jgi:hypothetical protein
VSITIVPECVAGNMGTFGLRPTGGLTKRCLLRKDAITFDGLTRDVSPERVLHCVHEPVGGLNPPASAARAERSRGYVPRFSSNPLLEWLAQRFQDVAAALRPFIQEAHPLVRPRPVARPRPLAAPDSPHRGDRVRRGATRPRGDQGGAGAGAAGDAREARRLAGVGEAPRGQDGGPPARQHPGEEPALSG